jgi:hypothetical protein
MSEELLPCPFCGGRNLFCGGDVECCDCGAGADSAMWNKRAAISVSDGGGSDASGASTLEKKEAVTRNTVLQKAAKAWFSQPRTYKTRGEAIQALVGVLKENMI